MITGHIKANGHRFQFTTDDEHAGWYPPEQTIHALQFCSEKGLIRGTCVDVGAHHGLYSLVMKHSGANKVIAIESDATAYMYLCANVVPQDIIPYHAQAGCDPMFELLVGNVAPEAMFLKIDVEGYEKPVLRGARSLLQGQANFYIELHPEIVKDYGFLWEIIDRSKYDIRQAGNELFGKSRTS